MCQGVFEKYFRAAAAGEESGGAGAANFV